jgi:hypothetical protein
MKFEIKNQDAGINQIRKKLVSAKVEIIVKGATVIEDEFGQEGNAPIRTAFDAGISAAKKKLIQAGRSALDNPETAKKKLRQAGLEIEKGIKQKSNKVKTSVRLR